MPRDCIVKPIPEHISFGIYYDSPTKICSQFWDPSGVCTKSAPCRHRAEQQASSQIQSFHTDTKSRVNTENKSNATQKNASYSEMDPAHCGGSAEF